MIIKVYDSKGLLKKGVYHVEKITTYMGGGSIVGFI